MTQLHTLIEHLAKLLDLAGVFIILAGVLLASQIFLRKGTKDGNWRPSYDRPA